MTKTHKRFSRKILLATLVASLNMLCVLCVHHGHRAEQHARGNIAHLPLYGSGRPASRSGRSLRDMACVVTDHQDHAISTSLTRKIVGGKNAAAFNPIIVALAARSLRFSSPSSSAVAVSVNELAYGDAPRGPTQPRAPPVA
jgi:hypothetical protein